MTTTQTDTTSVSTSHKSGWILAAICILGVMIQVDFTAINVALIVIAHSVNTDLATVQWVLSAYVLAWGALVLAAGRCADLFGKRRTFLLGTFLFMLGSALTGSATTAWFLIGGRVVQGIGGALFLPGLYTLVFTSFPEHKRGWALGVLTSSIAVGLAIGPTFGGVVLHLLNWRWIFFLNLPLGIPVMAIILWAVPREPWRLSDESMDYTGAAIIALALLILMFAFDQVSVWGLGSTKFLGSLLAFCGLAVIFIFYERRQTHPLIQLSLFSNRIFLGCSLTYIFMGFNFAAILIVGGLYLQNALDYSAFNTGFIFLIMTAMFAIFSVYSGKLVDKVDPRIPIVLGGVITTLSLFLFTFANQHSALWLPMLVLGLFGVGCGLGFPALNTTMMKSIPQNLLSTASSAFAMFGCIGNTLGLIFSSVLVVTFGQRKLSVLIANQPYTDTQQAALHNVIGSPHYSAAQLTDFPSSAVADLMEILRSSFISGMSTSMLVATGLSVLAVLISIVMIKSKAV